MMTKRTFIAIKIKLDQQVLNYINKIKNALSEENIKWVNPESLHLTLAFLGDTMVDSIPEIRNLLQKTSEKHSAFTIDLAHIGTFPPKGNPRVVWIGSENTNSLMHLQSEIEKSLIEKGLYEADKNFKAHLTLGRVKKINNKNRIHQMVDEYQHLFFQELKIDSFIYYESTLTPKGPIYTPIEIFKLSKL